MKFVIETARDQFLVRTEDALREKQAKFIAKLQSKGIRVQIHESSESKEVRVNHGAWIFDCDCGAGVAADPNFSAAYCFGCGAIHTHVLFPEEEDRLNVEHVLLARTKTANRNWSPGETLVELLGENGEHGVKL